MWIFWKLWWYNSIKKETNLKILAKKRIKEIERLKEEFKSNEDDLLEGETKIFKLLTDWEYSKNYSLHTIVVLESKLVKLEISPKGIDRIKNSVLLS